MTTTNAEWLEPVRKIATQRDTTYYTVQLANAVIALADEHKVLEQATHARLGAHQSTLLQHGDLFNKIADVVEAFSKSITVLENSIEEVRQMAWSLEERLSAARRDVARLDDAVHTHIHQGPQDG